MEKELLSSLTSIIQSQMSFYWIIYWALLTWLFSSIQIFFNFLSNKRIKFIDSKLQERLEELKISLQNTQQKNNKNIEYYDRLRQRKVENYNNFLLETVNYLTFLNSETLKKEDFLLNLKKIYWSLVLSSSSKIVYLSTNFLLKLNENSDDINSIFEELIIEMYNDIQSEGNLIYSKVTEKGHFSDILNVFKWIEKAEFEIWLNNKVKSTLEVEIIELLKINKNIKKIIYEPFIIKIMNNNNKQKYIPDLLVETKNNKRIGIEIKHSRLHFTKLEELNSPTLLKEYNLDRFILLTENDSEESINKKLLF